MVVPYGDPRPAYFRRNAFDLGEYGIGMLANSLEHGCDCQGEIRYFDVASHNSLGEPYALANAICLHEEDVGLLWKRINWRTNYTEARRSRRLVISFASVGNYEYGFYRYFYQDGQLQFVFLSGRSAAVRSQAHRRHLERCWRRNRRHSASSVRCRDATGPSPIHRPSIDLASPSATN
jgi:Cu2+-containing amine oxidase